MEPYFTYMKAATIRELRQELKEQEPEKLVELCLHLTRFKKENKELLTYLLFEAHDESAFIEGVKEEIDELFGQITSRSIYLRKKQIRKILRTAKKYIRYSKKKETEVQLLIHFCHRLKDMQPSVLRSAAMMNLFGRQIKAIKKALSYLHEDLQFDYKQMLTVLLS